MKKIALIACLSVVLLLGCVQEESLEGKVDRIAASHGQIQEYVIGQGYEREVKELGLEEVMQLKQQEMFKELPERELVEVKYSHPEKGTFVAIIDLEQEEVLKFYRIASISIG